MSMIKILKITQTNVEACPKVNTDLHLKSFNLVQMQLNVPCLSPKSPYSPQGYCEELPSILYDSAPHTGVHRVVSVDTFCTSSP